MAAQIKATHQGVLNIGGKIDLPCFVLEDGRRVLSRSGILGSLGLSENSGSKNGSHRLSVFIGQECLKSFISKETTVRTENPITFSLPQGGRAYGYDGNIMIDICNAIMEADEQDLLRSHQKHLAKQARVLMNAFARVGLVALIDEATGYQSQRGRDELNNLLNKYIADELMPWVKRFPDSFFEQICRLRGWQWNPMTKQGPRALSGVINELVYDLMPEGVSEEIRKVATDEEGRRAGKLHQALTPEIGAVHLEKHIQVLTTLARASSSWGRFKTSVNNYFTANTQLELL